MIEIKACGPCSCDDSRRNMPAAASSHSTPRISDILLPKEHGSWSLALEPLALGLIAASSIPGAFLAAGAFAAFLIRRPFQLAAGPREDARTSRARVMVIALAATAAICTLAAGLGAGFTALLPLIAAAPAALLFWVFDRKKEARALEAEIAGAAAFAVLPAAIATLAGRSPALALLLAATALARSVPTILTIRCYLRINKGQPATRTPAVLTSLLAAVSFTALFLVGIAPPSLVVLSSLLLGRTLLLLAPRFPRLPASRIGMAEAVVGVAYVLVAGLALM